MKRQLYANLLQWKDRRTRKPLIIYGVRQVGKTHLVKEFADREFRRTIYLNFEEDRTLGELFKSSLKPERILRDLEFRCDIEINTEKDILIFDEIQACPLALTSLKYFCEGLPQLAVVSAGSLLGLHLNGTSFPVGKVDLLNLYPMNFEEFLIAIGDQRCCEVLKEAEPDHPPSEQAHRLLWNRLKDYFVVGGMPECVKTFRDAPMQGYAAMNLVRDVQGGLIANYLADIAKHAGKVNAMHIERVLEASVRQLGSSQDGSSSRFKFKGVVPGISHHSRLVHAIDWLLSAGLLHKIEIAHAGYIPISAYTKDNAFKLFLCDVGLLGRMAQLAPRTIIGYEYGSYKGFFAENFVAQEFLATGSGPLYCWQEKQAEVEFVRDFDGRLLPIEVKSGGITRAKSLGIFSGKYAPLARILLSARPLSTSDGGKLLRVPLYLASKLQQFVAQIED